MFFFGFDSCFDFAAGRFFLLYDLDDVDLLVSFFVDGTLFLADFGLVPDTALDSPLVLSVWALVTFV